MKFEEAIAYCTKDDTRIDGPFEYGTKPASGKKYTCFEILTTPI